MSQRTVPLQPRIVAEKILKASLAILSAAMLVQLGAMARMGSFMRMSGDDYCYGAGYRQSGLISGVIHAYLNPGPFNGNRFSLTLFSNLAEIFGPMANAVIPGLAVAIFALGVFLLLRRIFRLSGSPQNGTITLLTAALALSLVFFTLMLAPDIRQSLYWRSAMLPYLAPVISGVYMALAVLATWDREKISIPALVGLFALGFIGGGFSETGAVFLAAGTAQGAVLALLGLPRQPERSRRPFLTAAAFLVAGIIAAMALLALAPSNINRMGDQITISQVATIGMQSAYGFVYGALSQYLVPNAVLILIFIASGFIASHNQVYPVWGGKTLIITTAGLILSTAVVIWSVMLPFAYAQQSYPEPRALVIARYELNLAIAFFAWIAGAAVGKRVSSWRANAASAVKILGMAGLILAAAYTIHLLPVTLQYQRLFAKWSTLWDQRNALITASARANADRVEVMVLDHVIPEVAELSAEPGNWYNDCAEGFYGIDEIQASLPGWDSPENN